MIIFAKEKKFYSANVAYVLTNEEVWFKDLGEETENPVGSVGLLINEMTAGIICHVESLKLNHEAIVWKIMLPFGRRLSPCATRLAAVFSMNFRSYLRA